MDAAGTLLVIGAAYWLLRARRKPKPRVRYVLRREPALAEGGSEAAVESPDEQAEARVPTPAAELPALAGPPVVMEAGRADGFEDEAEAESGERIVAAASDAAEPALTAAPDEPGTARPAEPGDVPAAMAAEAAELAEMSLLPSSEAAAPDPETTVADSGLPEPDIAGVPETTGAVREAQAAVPAPDEVPAAPVDEAQEVVAAQAVEAPATAIAAAPAEDAPDRAGDGASADDHPAAVSEPGSVPPPAAGNGLSLPTDTESEWDASAAFRALPAPDAPPMLDTNPEPAASTNPDEADRAPAPGLASEPSGALASPVLPPEPSSRQNTLEAASDEPEAPSSSSDWRSAGDAEADRVAAREIVERFFDGRHARQASWAAVAAILAVAEGEIEDGQSVVEALEQLGIGIEPLPADGDAPPLPDGTVMLFLIPETARRRPEAIRAGDPEALPGALPVDLRLAIELAAAVASSEAEPDEAGGARPLSFASLVAAVRRRSDLSGVARARALALAIATSSNQAQRGRCGARFGRMALPDREAVIAAAADLIRPEPTAWPGLEASIRRRLDPLILQAAAVDDAQRPERPKRRARPTRKATAG